MMVQIRNAPWVAPIVMTVLVVVVSGRHVFSEQASRGKAPNDPAAVVAEQQSQDPDSLDAILRDWEEATRSRHRLDARFRRVGYNLAFEVEHRATGLLAIDQDGRALYKIAPAKIASGELSRRLGSERQPFTIEPAHRSERFYWTGKSFVSVYDDLRTFDELILSDRVDEGSFFSAFNRLVKEMPLARPFLLGMPAKELQRHFQMKLQKQTEHRIWLEFVPKNKQGAWSFDRATLILSKGDFAPRAIMTVLDLQETVHLFSEVRINPAPEDRLEVIDPSSLEGYQTGNSN
jgi:hypothetical protein